MRNLIALIREALCTSYTGTSVPQVVVTAGTYFLAALAILMGAGYLSSPESDWFGLPFFVGGFMLFTARVCRSHFFLWLGHGICGAFYTVLSLALYQQVFDDSFADRASLSATAIAAAHLILCFSMGPMPKEWFEERKRRQS